MLRVRIPLCEVSLMLKLWIKSNHNSVLVATLASPLQTFGKADRRKFHSVRRQRTKKSGISQHVIEVLTTLDKTFLSTSQNLKNSVALQTSADKPSLGATRFTQSFNLEKTVVCWFESQSGFFEDVPRQEQLQWGRLEEGFPHPRPDRAAAHLHHPLRQVRRLQSGQCLLHRLLLPRGHRIPRSVS